MAVNGFETVEADLGGGNDTAVLYDGSANDTLTVSQTVAEMVYGVNGASVSVTGYESVSVGASQGGTGDKVVILDSGGNDIFTASNAGATMQYGSGTPTTITVGSASGFELLEGVAVSGSDSAYLYDTSGNDVYTVMQSGVNEATMLPQNGTAYSRKAIGFDKYYGYSTLGGTDEAHLYDSPGNDTLTAKPTDVKLAYVTGPLAGMELRAFSFERVTAHAGDGLDTALFYDHADSSEAFTANHNQAEMIRTTVDSWTYDNIAMAFELVYAYATWNASTSDTAEITDSASNDIIRTSGADNDGYIGYNYLPGPPETYAPFVYAKGFDSIEFNCLNGGIDTVVMSDSYGDDTFTSDADWAQMTDGLSYLHRVEDLSGGQTGDHVTINRLTGSGTDRDQHLATIDYWFAKIGGWI